MIFQICSSNAASPKAKKDQFLRNAEASTKITNDCKTIESRYFEPRVVVGSSVIIFSTKLYCALQNLKMVLISVIIYLIRHRILQLSSMVFELLFVELKVTIR